MVFNKNSIFYVKAKNMLDEYVANGGNIDDLSTGSKEYDYIKNAKLYDENGNYINVETRFALLGHPRKPKLASNVKDELIKEVNSYLAQGGDLHVDRKKLPFYERLNTYTRSLKLNGKNITHEQAMKDLGFRNYSDLYFRCKELEEIKNFRDEFGYVDDYRKDAKMKAYIIDLAKTLNIPYYILIELVLDEKLKKCSILTEYVSYVQNELKDYINKHGSLKGIKRKDESLYEKFNMLVKYYSDGTDCQFTKEEWLNVFGLDNVEHAFRDSKIQEIDLDEIMFEIKENNKGKTIYLKDLDKKTYRLILKKSIRLGVDVAEIFKTYGLKCNGIKINRLSKVYVDEVPYISEMRRRKAELLDTSGLCKEEVFEQNVKISIKVYEEYKDKIFNYLTNSTIENNI